MGTNLNLATVLFLFKYNCIIKFEFTKSFSFFIKNSTFTVLYICELCEIINPRHKKLIFDHWLIFLLIKMH